MRHCVNISETSLCQMAYNGSLKHLNISNSNQLEGPLLQALGDNCKSLESLDISFCRKIPENAVGFLVDACPALARLTLFGMSQLGLRFFNGHRNEKVVLYGVGTPGVLCNWDCLRFDRQAKKGNAHSATLTQVWCSPKPNGNRHCWIPVGTGVWADSNCFWFANCFTQLIGVSPTTRSVCVVYSCCFLPLNLACPWGLTWESNVLVQCWSDVTVVIKKLRRQMDCAGEVLFVCWDAQLIDMGFPERTSSQISLLWISLSSQTSD